MSAFEGMSTVEREELIISLATLICADAKIEITKDNLNKLVKESGNKIASYWSTVFAANCEGKDILDVLAAPGAGAASASSAATSSAAAPAAEEEKKEEEEEEEEVDMSGGGLFGGNEDEDW